MTYAMAYAMHKNHVFHLAHQTYKLHLVLFFPGTKFLTTAQVQG